MKKFTKLFLNLLLIISQLSITCPTCVARIQPDSPAFFNEDFYLQTPAAQTAQLDNDTEADKNKE